MSLDALPASWPHLRQAVDADDDLFRDVMDGALVHERRSDRLDAVRQDDLPDASPRAPTATATPSSPVSSSPGTRVASKVMSTALGSRSCESVSCSTPDTMHMPAQRRYSLRL